MEKYRYLGEIDCPYEMYGYFATKKEVESCGGRKRNWFLCSDGTFYSCHDLAANDLFDSGNVVRCEFPFEIERLEKYDSLSREGKIAFRMKLQGISKEFASELVNRELGVKNNYLFEVYEPVTKKSFFSILQGESCRVAKRELLSSLNKDVQWDIFLISEY